uniref:RNA-directed DNA polymerase n=1 Tax=Strongyloides venezuelensis TaxID=75913 RepID=A0A0K0FHG8_STRVS
MKLNLAALQTIENFDGEGSFPDFRTCFETSLLLVGLQKDGTILTLIDELKASMLYIKLFEEVRQNISHLNNDDIKNYKKLVDVLEEIYPSKQLTQIQLRLKLNSLKRSDFKNVKEFCEAIEKLCKKIYVKCSKKERQKLTIVEKCGKFDNTIHTAIDNNEISRVDQAIEFINPTSVTDKECNYCKVKGHLKRDCEKLKLRREKDAKITTKTETITALREISEINKCFITSELEKAVSVRVFVDAGASVSLISKSIADKIIQKGAFNCPNETCGISWGMGSNSKLNTYGSIITIVKVKKEIHNLKFFITDDKILVNGMNCDVLLGADQLKRIGEVGINFNERICTSGKEKVSMLDYSGLKVISNIQKTLQFEDDESVDEKKKIKDSLIKEFPMLKDEEALGCCKYACSDPEVIPHDGSPKFRRITVSQVQQNLLNEYTDRLISQGVLVPSSTSYVSSPMTIPKPNSNDYRTVTDLREINKLIKPHRYPSPTYIEITKSLVTSSLFSKIDLSKVFHQIPISKNFGKFLGVKTYKGIYEYARMPQGYKNASSVFQMILDRIVGKFEGVVIYIDDILLFTQNDISVHVQLIINVVKALISYGLIIILSKCQFCKTKVSYLGFVIRSSGTSINIVATEPLRNQKFPRSKKELRSFLFAMNTYNRFIKNFALIAKPLTNMLSNKSKLVQGPKEIEAFEKLKDCLLNCKTLCHPESGKDFYIKSDASMEGLSAKSKALPPGYLELRGFITAVRSFEIYIQSEHTYVLTDHKPLISLMSTTQNPILLRWIQEIASFNVTLKYIEGDKNNFADYLSRSSPSTQQFDV